MKLNRIHSLPLLRYTQKCKKENDIEKAGKAC